MEPFRRHQKVPNNNNDNNHKNKHNRWLQMSPYSVLTNLTSPSTVFLDYGDRHPWEQYRQLGLGFFTPPTTTQSSSSSSSTTSTTSSSSTYQPIRIQFLTNTIQALIGQDATVNSKISYILNTVLPQVSSVWSSHLRVVPNTSPIPIDSSVCFGFFNGQIPVSFLDNGVPNADLVIIASMANSLTTSGGTTIDFCSTGVLALASFCSQDQYDRPTIGFINFCPPTGSSSSNTLAAASTTHYGGRGRRRRRRTQISAVSQQDDVLVAIHEVGHVLGMSIELFPYFRDPLTGAPLTPRPIANTDVACTNNRGTQSMIFPSSSIIQSGMTSNGLLYYEIATPRVQSVVRNHFNCQSLNGARLEIQDTSATACVGSHWDERLQYSELMSPIFSGTVDVLSPLTLALMEDSGWYQVDYGNTLLSPFGQGGGCEFVNELCIINDSVPSWGKDYFCATPTYVQSDGSVNINDNSVICDPNHYQMTLCALFDQSQVPSGFLTGTIDVTYFSNQNLVGTFEQASFCPMPIFSTNIDCTNPSTQQFTTYQGESYSSSSRCVNANFQDPSTGSQVVMPGCFNVQCDQENFRVVVNGIPCDYDFQQISIQTTSSTSATMECPRLATVCPDLFCPEDCSGRGVCQYSSAKAPQCQCSDHNITADDCQNATLSAAVPIYYSQSSAATQFPLGSIYLGTLLPITLTLALLSQTWTA
jgi:hypothetical protein